MFTPMPGLVWGTDGRPRSTSPSDVLAVNIEVACGLDGNDIGGPNSLGQLFVFDGNPPEE